MTLLVLKKCNNSNSKKSSNSCNVCRNLQILFVPIEISIWIGPVIGVGWYVVTISIVSSRELSAVTQWSKFSVSIKPMVVYLHLATEIVAWIVWTGLGIVFHIKRLVQRSWTIRSGELKNIVWLTVVVLLYDLL